MCPSAFKVQACQAQGVRGQGFTVYSYSLMKKNGTTKQSVSQSVE